MAVGHTRSRCLKHLRPLISSDQPPEQKCCEGKTDDPVTEPPSHAIGQALNRRSPGLGLFHHANDPSKSRFGTHTRDLNHQGRLKVEAA